jgi:hypothetical protein
VQAIRKVYCPATPTPSPSPTPDPVECNPGQAAYCWDIFCTGLDPNDCNDCDWNPPPGECGSPQAGCNCSPILIDVDGNGFSLSNAANGVEFDLNGDGEFQARLGWTAPGSDDAWLVLDRNTNGAVDSGQELFGNFTPQPPGAEQHGFLALQTFDHLANGGNNDGRIDSQDAIYSSLRLWRDFNRDGISQTPELSPLAQLEVESIDLDFHQSKKRDDHGNWFKYRSMIRDANGIHVGKWAWDVYLVHEPLNGQVSLVPDYSIFEFSGPSCATSTTNNLNQEVIPSSGV